MELPLAPFQVQLCKPCVRLLKSFRYLDFGVDFGFGLVLHTGHPNLAAWLDKDTDLLQVSEDQ